MADENIVTNITASANFSNLIGDLNRVTASLTNLQTQVSATNKSLAAQIAVVNRQFGDTLRSTGQFSTYFASSGNDIEKFGQNLDKGRLKLRDYYRSWQDHHKTTSGLVRDLAQQQVRLQNAIMQPLGRNAEGIMQYAVHVPRGLDLVKNKTSLANQELKIMNKVMQEGANQLINWGKNTQWAGRQLTVGLTVPLAAFGKAAADAFKTADEQLVRLTKVYGDLGGATRSELTQVRKDVSEVAKELSQGYGASFNETLALAADIAATGKTGGELLGSIKETTRLAVLGEVDRQEAMKATLAIQSAFNQNTQELSQSIDFLNSVENQTSTSLQDLVEAIPKAGPVVKGLGGDIKDLALYLTAMKEGGINASEGANAIKSSLASLINPTNVAVEKFKSFGIDLLGIVSTNAGNVTQTLFALQAALDKLDPLQKQQAIEQLFGKFQFARMGALFDNLGKQGSQTLKVMDLMKASSQDLANVAGREIKQVTESASGQYRRALESLKADLADVGEQFLTINTYVIKFVDNIVKFANNLPGPVKQILSFLGGITAIAGPLIMLTGVLGNFFGYIVKGVYHFKSLFKNAEGWRMLTPEILAANKAGSQAESTFYNDARAASILNQSLRDLAVQYENLAVKAQSGAISVNPIISTAQGNAVQGVGAGGRQVNPTHALVGPENTRASAHMVPRKVDQPRTIFGLVPGSVPLNLAVGENPQVYMDKNLPKIPGVTSVQTRKYGEVSTGVVASEAARHHAMTAALAMQSTAEVEKLKKMMATTGTVTSEFMSTFDDILPITTKITQGAAMESAAIVAELQAGKLNVDQARAKIIALNVEIENMLGVATSQYATGMGRTMNLTNVPTLNQPVTNAAGKSNMRELFKSRTKGFMGNIARALGVRTSGAGYNIETTIPRRLNSGGYVYTANEGSIVPGPNVNADVVPAMLTPGEFVVNAKSTKENLPLLQQINGGAGSSGPNHLTGGQIQTLVGMPSEFMRRIGMISGARRTDTRSLRSVFSPGAMNYDQMGSRAGRNSIWSNPILAAGKPGPDEVVGHIYSNQFYRQLGGPAGQSSSPRLTASGFQSATGLSLPASRSGYTGTYDVLPNQFMTITNAFNTRLNRGGATPMEWFESPRKPEHLLSLMDLLTSQGITQSKALPIAQKVLGRINNQIARLPENSLINERMFGNIVTNSTRVELNRLKAIGELNERQNAAAPALPRGTYTPGAYKGYNRRGYNRGGLVASALQVLAHSPINKLSQLRNYLRARSMVKQGMFHGSYGENTAALEGRNVLDSAISRDKFHGMGFYSTSSPREASRYAEGYNTTMDGGYGTVNQIMNLPRGQYIDFTRKNLKAQNIQLYKALGGKDFKYAGEDLGPILRQLGIKGAIMPRISAGRTSDKEQDLAEWLAWADPSGVVTKELIGKLPQGRIPGRATGGPVNAGQPYMVGEKGPELFVPRNNGGIIPNIKVRAYHDGDFVGMPASSASQATWTGPLGGHAATTPRSGIKSAFTSGLKNPYGRGLGSTMTKRPMGFGAQMGIGMAGGIAGNLIGGPVGMAVSVASSFLPMLTALKGFTGLLPTITKIASILGRLTIPGLLVSTLGTGIKLLLDWKKRAEDAGKANRLAFGGTTDSFASVGIKNYKTIADRIKDVNEELKLHKAQVLSTYESYAKAGPTGLTLTIKELKEAIKYAKENQKDYVNAFNTIDSSKTVEYATQLKAQFVAMGMSASDATNQIYAIIQASDKASQSISAISNSAFKAIQDQTSGIKSMISTLGKALKSKDFNAEEFAQGMETLVNSLLTFQDGLIGSKDKMGNILDQADALKTTMDKIKDLNGANVEISGKQLDNIKNQSLVYTTILGKAENLSSIYAKIALYQQGFGEMLNLAAMSAKDTIDFTNSLTTIQNTVNDITESTGKDNPLGPLAEAIATAKKQSDSAGNAVKALKKIDADYYDNQLKKIQKLIDALEKERQKRLDLLKVNKESQDFAVTIEQSQNKIKNLIAGGQLEAAAQEQLNLKKLSQERQYQMAQDSLNKVFDAKREKLDAQAQAAQDAKDKLSKNLTTAQTTAANKTTNLADLQSSRDQLEAIAIRNVDKTKKEITSTDIKEILNIIKAMKDAGGASKTAALGLEKQYGTGKNFALNYIEGFNKVIDSRSKSDTAFAKAVALFSNAVTKFSAKTESTSTYNKDGSIEFGANKPKAVTGKTLGAAAKEVNAGTVQARKWMGPAGDVYDLFTWNGKTYALDTVGGVYLYDTSKQTLGKKQNITGKSTFGRVVPGRDYVVGERGPELFRTDMPGNIMPKYNIPNSNYSSNNAGNNGTMVGKMSLVQNIYASPGMDEQQLANLAAKQAVAFIRQADQNNNYKVGKGVTVN